MALEGRAERDCRPRLPALRITAQPVAVGINLPAPVYFADVLGRLFDGPGYEMRRRDVSVLLYFASVCVMALVFHCLHLRADGARHRIDVLTGSCHHQHLRQ